MKVNIVFAQDYDDAIDNLNRLNYYFSKELDEHGYYNTHSAPLTHLLMASLLSDVCDSILQLALNENGIYLNYYDNVMDISMDILTNSVVLRTEEVDRICNLSKKFRRVSENVSGAFGHEIDIAEIANVALYLNNLLLEVKQRIQAYDGPKYKSRLFVKGVPFNITLFFKMFYRKLRYGDGHIPYRYTISLEENIYSHDNTVDVSYIQKYLDTL